jgi:hypothetical protein
MIDEEGELKAPVSAAAAAAAAASGSKNSGTPKLVADFGGRTSDAEPRVNCKWDTRCWMIFVALLYYACLG